MFGRKAKIVGFDRLRGSIESASPPKSYSYSAIVPRRRRKQLEAELEAVKQYMSAHNYVLVQSEVLEPRPRQISGSLRFVKEGEDAGRLRVPIVRWPSD
jgi:hypothetical protein